MRIGRREGLAVAIGFVLVGAAFVLPRLNLGIKPRSDIGLERFATRAGAAPIFGYWDAMLAGARPRRFLPQWPLWRGGR